MKTPLTHFLTIAAALGTSLACAQNEPAPRPPDGAPGREENRRPKGEDQPRPGDFGRRDFPNPRRALPTEERRLPRELPPFPAKPQPYLGVATGPLDPALSAQLGFTPGLGLIVEEVIADSPAATAGVQALDVIKQLNDQLVSSPAHLSALARHFGKDTEVTLLVLRKGQEQKLSMKIGERLMRDPIPAWPPAFGGYGMGMPGMGMQPYVRGSATPARNNDDANRLPREPREGQIAPPQKPSADLFREVGPGGAPEVQSSQDRVSTTWSTANAKVMLRDANGEIEVRSENGKRTMTAKNPSGETTFEGPIDTEDQRKAIPAEFRKMLEQVEVRSRGDRRPVERNPAPREEGRAPAGREDPKPPRAQPGIQ